MTNKSLTNELLFEYASGTTNMAKSLLVSTYFYLNTSSKGAYEFFEGYLGNQFDKVNKVHPKNLKAVDCISDSKIDSNLKINKNINPLNSFIPNIKWEKVFKGFYEYQFTLSDNENVKLIKMEPEARVPLHSHNGKEYILVLEGSFCDENGIYKKGDLQINDSNITHTPEACKNEGCICLTITEKELVFFGRFAPILNIITFVKSIFKGKN